MMAYPNQTNPKNIAAKLIKANFGLVKYIGGGSPSSSSASFPILAKLLKKIPPEMPTMNDSTSVSLKNPFLQFGASSLLSANSK